MTAARDPVDLNTLLAAIERIEAMQPGFRVRVGVAIVRSVLRSDPESLRGIGSELDAALDRLLVDAASRAWKPHPLIQAELVADGSDLGEPDPAAAFRVAKRHALRTALFEFQHGERPSDLPSVKGLEGEIEKALWWASEPRHVWIGTVVIALAERELRRRARRREVPMTEPEKVAESKPSADSVAAALDLLEHIAQRATPAQWRAVMRLAAAETLPDVDRNALYHLRRKLKKLGLMGDQRAS